ncbi:sulfotransferase domain-containing protein [Abyssibacter sp.]|uniref:sulfotransferase domain-containing protein n=1 Tax=Abyssibacter sp. TaxID=2320200 RepID=UPI000C392B6E|nr:sulfotransferase domain-containing protein [Abyssibacter sp.]MBB86725.1 hypothetical protein [Xanthomonadales bacterium]MCK5859826.1 sulfotransferase domain-containing protein [Abyssibacter sp.]
MSTRFCIIAAPRTGSNWLCSVLDTQPAVVCHYEVFHRWEIYSSFHEPLRSRPLLYAGLRLYRDLMPMRFLDALMQRSFAAHPQAQAAGFKLFPGHNRRVLRAIVRDENWKVIFLTRNNYLAQYSSFKIAKASGQWAKGNVVRRGSAKKKIHFDATEFRRFASRRDAETTRISAMLASREHVQLDYSEIATRMHEVFELLHIGAPDGDALRTQIEKQNTNDLLARFDNPDAVLDCLSAQQQADYLGTR